jgi:hypothetical protein
MQIAWQENTMNHSVNKPFPQSFWVIDKLLCAGCFPGDLVPERRDEKLQGLIKCGLRRYIDLMDPGDRDASGACFEPYPPILRQLAADREIDMEFVLLSIPDASVPSIESMTRILDYLDASVEGRIPTYVHCWGGHGRTSTVVACYFIRHGMSADEAIERIKTLRRPLPKNHYPFEGQQESFVRSWVELIRTSGVTAP